MEKLWGKDWTKLGRANLEDFIVSHFNFTDTTNYEYLPWEISSQVIQEQTEFSLSGS